MKGRGTAPGRHLLLRHAGPGCSKVPQQLWQRREHLKPTSSGSLGTARLKNLSLLHRGSIIPDEVSLIAAGTHPILTRAAGESLLGKHCTSEGAVDTNQLSQTTRPCWTTEDRQSFAEAADPQSLCQR